MKSNKKSRLKENKSNIVIYIFLGIVVVLALIIRITGIQIRLPAHFQNNKSVAMYFFLLLLIISIVLTFYFRDKYINLLKKQKDLNSRIRVYKYKSIKLNEKQLERLIQKRLRQEEESNFLIN